jgi:prepilin-type processing-associated H-X9-DG protein
MDADEALVMGIKRTSLLNHISGTNAAFVDGSVRFFRGDFSAAQRRAIISISGKDDKAVAAE